MEEIERISATVPKALADEMRKIAREEHTSLSGLVATACGDLVRHHRGTWCEICEIQNLPGSRFCCVCGRPISEEAIREIEAAVAVARDSPEFRAALLAISKKGQK